LTLRSPIFRKLLLAAVLLTCIALGSADFLLTRYTADRERASIRQQMEQCARIVAPTIPAGSLEPWAEQVDGETGYRVTLIDSRGVVLADSRHDPETMENHASRPEVAAALHGQPGSDIRRSATLDVDFSYFAMPLDRVAPGPAVLRLAVPADNVRASIGAVRALILRASGIAILIALVAAYLISQSFTRRIHRIETYANELVKADYSGKLSVEADDELGSVARSLRTMAEQFRGVMTRLSTESTRREAILGSMVEGVLSVDRNLRVIFCNDAFARAVEAPTPMPENVSVLQFVRDPAFHSLLTRVVTDRQPARERMTLIGARGRTFEVQAIPIDDGSAGRAIVTLHDISELERLERVRKDFVANVSHELRTPLAAIRGYTETLLDGALEDPEHNRKFLEIVAAQTDRLTDLASDLLALSEVETERTPPAMDRVLLADIAASAIRTVESEAAATKVRVYLGDCDDAYVMAHAPRLERALLNLLVNGIRYNRPGGEVQVAIARMDDTVRISVSDTGIGIPAPEIPRIFERFYRVDKARSRQTGGTGLGLSIVKHNIEQMGGRVTVESQLGKGSTFSVLVPAA